MIYTYLFNTAVHTHGLIHTVEAVGVGTTHIMAGNVHAIVQVQGGLTLMLDENIES